MRVAVGVGRTDLPDEEGTETSWPSGTKMPRCSRTDLPDEEGTETVRPQSARGELSGVAPISPMRRGLKRIDNDRRARFDAGRTDLPDEEGTETN